MHTENSLLFFFHCSGFGMYTHFITTASLFGTHLRSFFWKLSQRASLALLGVDYLDLSIRFDTWRLFSQ